MKGIFNQPHGEDVEFELFSNIVLKFTAILIVVMVLLALNVGQKLDSLISPNSFSGGMARPAIYIGAWDYNDPQINQEDRWHYQITLFSPSLEAASTYVKDGQVFSSVEGETFSGALNGSFYTILRILGAIHPGSFTVDGQATPLVVPHTTGKKLDINGDGKLLLPPDPNLALRVLQLWSGLYKNKIFPVRAYSEFSKSRAKIYVETMTLNGEKRMVLGHGGFAASAIKDGSLDFLTGLSSANSEIVYLGDVERDGDKATNSRILFFESHGFPEAAEAFRRSSFPGESVLADARDFGITAEIDFNSVTPEVRSELLRRAGGKEEVARRLFRDEQINMVSNLYDDRKFSQLVREGREPKPSDLPPILGYPEAWKAYIEYRLSLKPVPPRWLVEDFLTPLGFDKRVVLLEQ